MPHDVIKFPNPQAKVATPPTNSPTFGDRLRARLYCGWYGVFMHGGGSCMSSRRGHIRLTPMEERRFCETVLDNLSKRPGDWRFDGYCMVHRPSSTEFWMANGRAFFAVYLPHRIPLRRGVQRRLHRAMRRLRNEQHRQRHREYTDEAKAFIGQFAA